MRAAGEARYLDYEPPDDPERAVALRLRDDPWLSSGVETLALDWAVTEGMPAELARTREIVTARVDQVRRLVKQRLTHEINYWDMRHAELLEAEAAGRQLKMKPETAYDRARDLERRLEHRLADLDAGRGADRQAAGRLRRRAGRSRRACWTSCSAASPTRR